MRFRLRLIISISLLIALTFGIGGTLLISSSFTNVYEEQKDAAISDFESVLNTLHLIKSLDKTAGIQDMVDALSQMEQQEAAKWQALSLTNGNTISFLSGKEAYLSNNIELPPSGKCSYIVVFDDDTHTSARLIAFGAISSENDPSAYKLKASFDMSSAFVARSTQQRLFVVIYAIVVSLGIIIASAMSVILTKRLNKLTIAAQKISDGDLSVRSSLDCTDEFGKLSAVFDNMADSLQDNITSLEEQVQKQEAFLGAFAHELKTPMTSIIGYADLLRQDVLEKHDRISASNYIFSEGQRLEKLSFKLQDLLLLEKDEFNFRPVSLSALLSDIENTLKVVLRKKGIRFVCRSSEGYVLIEPDLIKSLIYNLIDNAAKAMDGEGLIAVKGDVTKTGFKIQVVDNGRGMDENELSKLTEPFYRIDKSRSRKQGGAGLGLSLCARIAELHNGTIAFKSAVGHGTCVTIEINSGRGDGYEG